MRKFLFAIVLVALFSMAGIAGAGSLDRGVPNRALISTVQVHDGQALAPNAVGHHQLMNAIVSCQKLTFDLQNRVCRNALNGPAGPAGATGATGAAGAQGVAGPEGSQGPVGPAGPAGANGTCAPLVESDLSATYSHPTCQGPQGIQGPQGPQGIPGVKGDQGPQGVKGATGEEGEDGAKGATGATGPQGPKGDKGNPGTNGTNGTSGVPYPVCVVGESIHPGACGQGGPNGNGTTVILLKQA